MFYFKTFPVVDYQYRSKISKKSVDILRRYKVVKKIIDSNVYDTYVIGESETPQSLALKLYNDVSLYWGILLFNEIINPLYEWPVPDSKISSRLDSQYPGVSLFVTENETTIGDSNVNTKGSNSSYTIGENIEIYDDNHELVDSGSIYEYERSTGNMKVSGVDSFVLGDSYYITDENQQKKMYIARKFDFAKLSLKYFLDENKKIVSPYYTGFGSKMIDRYVNNDDLGDVISVSILDYEIAKNDERRILKIPDLSTIRSLEQKIRDLNRS